MENEKRPIFQVGHNTNLLVLLERDTENLLTWVNDQEVTRFLTPHFPISEEGERQFIKRSSTGSMSDIILIIGDTDRTPIGSVGLHRIDWVSRRATLGIFIGEKSYWGKGHGTEAMLLMLYYAFIRLNLHKVELEVYDFNTRAIRCYNNCGFKQEGIRTHHIFRGGSYCDVIMMGIFLEDFKPLWDKYQAK